MNILALRDKALLYLFSSLLVFMVSRPVRASSPDSLMHVTVQQAKTLLDKDTTIVVLDVRTPEEFKSQAGHLPRAINIPVQELDKRLAELVKFRSRKILVYCRSGNRSIRASEILLKKDFKIIHMDGGILQWNVAFPPSAVAREHKQ